MWHYLQARLQWQTNYFKPILCFIYTIKISYCTHKIWYCTHRRLLRNMNHSIGKGNFKKKQNKFGVEGEGKFFIVWNWFYSKIYFNLAKMFWSNSKWQQIKQCFRLEHSSVIKFLVTEKCKPYKIYRRICMEKNVLVKKSLQMG